MPKIAHLTSLHRFSSSPTPVVVIRPLQYTANTFQTVDKEIVCDCNQAVVTSTWDLSSSRNILSQCEQTLLETIAITTNKPKLVSYTLSKLAIMSKYT